MYSILLVNLCLGTKTVVIVIVSVFKMSHELEKCLPILPAADRCGPIYLSIKRKNVFLREKPDVL